MSLLSDQRDPKRYRFPLPNEIWRWNLKPPAFSILSYLCYLRTHSKTFAAPDLNGIAAQLHMSVDLAQAHCADLIRRGLLDGQMVPTLANPGKNFFSLPYELFSLGLGHGAITVYAYLVFCEDRRTHQCYPSYKTIAATVHLAVNTVIKHVTKLADKQLITVERTSYIDNKGMKWNSNNRYTILPIRAAVHSCYQQQLEQLTIDAYRQKLQHTP